MNVDKRTKEIIKENKCKCFTYDEKSSTLHHNLTIEDARKNLCNNIVFTQITAFLFTQNVKFTVNENNTIKIELPA